MTKQEDRSSISVSKDTRARFMTYARELAWALDEDITQDAAVNKLLDCADVQRNTKRKEAHSKRVSKLEKEKKPEK